MTRRPAPDPAVLAWREEFFRRRLSDCERAWKAGVTPALLDALSLCEHYQRPLPAWLTKGVKQKLESALNITRGHGRTPSDLAKYRQNQIHYERFDLVRELRDRKDELAELGYAPTWPAAYENASKALIGTPAFGSPATIRASYLLVQAAMRRGRGPLFYMAMSMSGEA